MTGQVHANSDDLRRLQRDVDKCVTAVAQSLKDLERAVARADWNDKARNDFEAKLKEATGNAKRTVDRLSELKPILTKHISALAQYHG